MAKEVGEGLGISGFTLGILSVVMVLMLGGILSFVSITLSIIGFVFCFIQQKKNPTKMGKAGIFLNVIGFVLSVIYLVFLVKTLIPVINQYMQQLQNASPK